MTLYFAYATLANVLRSHDFLIAAQNADGGWGYKRGGMSFVEPTAAALLALVDQSGEGATRARGTAFLRALQRDDGGWGINALDAESGWMTAWAAWALAREDTASAARGGEWLLRTEGIRITKPEDVARIRALLHIDSTIKGWPWQVGDAAWIFPTALALCALNALQLSAHPRAREGIQFLLDRALPEGGWNIGNPFMVTGGLPATVINTALTLIALRELQIENETVTRARGWLEERTRSAQTAAELAWANWVNRAFEADDHATLARLNALQRDDGSWDGNPFTTAIAALAQPPPR